MALISPYNPNGWANRIQRALNQFTGAKITPQLKAQVQATVEQVVRQEDPYNEYIVDVVMDNHGQMQVNMKQKSPFGVEPGPFKTPEPPSVRTNYKYTMKNQARISNEYVTFYHDPRDIETKEAYEPNQFLMY